jgi:hypothetical protein
MTAAPQSCQPDIVERLRNFCVWNSRHSHYDPVPVCKEAADRIEELTKALEWRDGAPQKPWSLEWFIAETTYGERIVLVALPDEWTYDFKTADETYIKADKIKRWMQFPDSQFIAPVTSAVPLEQSGSGK